jgi:hypothetical protein
MDLLIVEPLEDEVTQWLTSRHTVRYAPELAHDPRAFRQALYNVRALIIPPSVTLDAQALHYAPVLCAAGRVSAGAGSIDLVTPARAPTWRWCAASPPLHGRKPSHDQRLLSCCAASPSSAPTACSSAASSAHARSG